MNRNISIILIIILICCLLTKSEGFRLKPAWSTIKRKGSTVANKAKDGTKAVLYTYTKAAGPLMSKAPGQVFRGPAWVAGGASTVVEGAGAAVAKPIGTAYSDIKSG